jgi:hypothetical protein
MRDFDVGNKGATRFLKVCEYTRKFYSFTSVQFYFSFLYRILHPVTVDCHCYAHQVLRTIEMRFCRFCSALELFWMRCGFIFNSYASITAHTHTNTHTHTHVCPISSPCFSWGQRSTGAPPSSASCPHTVTHSSDAMNDCSACCMWPLSFNCFSYTCVYSTSRLQILHALSSDWVMGWSDRSSNPGRRRFSYLQHVHTGPGLPPPDLHFSRYWSSSLGDKATGV